MKKILSIILSVTLLLPLGLISGFAAGKGTDEPAKTPDAADALSSAFADGENSLIVFVTGIGQSFSYLFDESYLEKDAFAKGTLQDYENYAPLIAEGKYKARWNLFVNDFSEAFADKNTVKTVAKLVGQLLGTLFLRRNMVKEAQIRDLVRSLFSYNLIDENGKGSDRLVTPRYTCPLSDYPGVINENGEFDSEAKHRFYTSIPCAEVAAEKLGANYEDYLYCFNYNPFSFTSKNVEDLHAYLETVLANNRVGADKVVLVPMSMGATVVSAFLAKYPDVAENHVRRVVSIVGGWNGSDVVLDLIYKRYPENSAELFYNGIIADLVGEPWGYVVNMALRLFSKQALRDFIDEALGVFVEELFFRTPSLLTLVPDYAYADVAPMIKNPNVRAQTDMYYAAQSTLKSRLAALEAQGVTFSFISGYGLPFGAVTSDYEVFGFMRSAEETNSDEIINISSTAPGTAFVPYNQKFADAAGRILSPDGSIDIAGTYYKDSSWFFRGQKHELEYNNTAIRLAIELALGNIKTVADCADPAGKYYFPQFNGARYVRDLTRDYIPAMEKYLAEGGKLTPAQAKQYADVKAMLASTVNDYDADNAKIEDFANLLVTLGLLDPPAKESKIKSIFNAGLKRQNDLTNRVFGAKGYLDFCS